jgi:hypothetical protein
MHSIVAPTVEEWLVDGGWRLVGGVTRQGVFIDIDDAGSLSVTVGEAEGHLIDLGLADIELLVSELDRSLMSVLEWKVLGCSVTTRISFDSGRQCPIGHHRSRFMRGIKPVARVIAAEVNRVHGLRSELLATLGPTVREFVDHDRWVVEGSLRGQKLTMHQVDGGVAVLAGDGFALLQRVPVEDVRELLALFDTRTLTVVTAPILAKGPERYLSYGGERFFPHVADDVLARRLSDRDRVDVPASRGPEDTASP